MFPGTYSIQGLGIDKHAFHSHTGKKSYEINSTSSSFVSLPIGSVFGEEEVTNLFDKFETLRSKARARTGDQRSAAGGRQGHQFTPAMIEALLRQAIGHSGICFPSGGFTDVGLHTGGKHRDSCFAVVRSVYDWVLNQNSTHHNFPHTPTFLNVTMAHFHMFVIKEFYFHQANFVITEMVPTRRSGNFNFLFCIIRRAVCDAAELSCYGYDVAHFHTLLNDMATFIHERVKTWDELKLKRNALCSRGTRGRQANSSIQLTKMTNPMVSIPNSLQPPCSSIKSIFELHDLVSNNLCALTFPNIKSSLASVENWSKIFQGNCKRSTTNAIFYLRYIESFFWRLSECHFNAAEPLNISNIANVMSLVDSYRSVLNDYLNGERENSISKDMAVYVRCLEILLVWVSYCVVFNSISTTYPHVMKGFGVALKFSDLQHLVLHDKRHRDVLERVVLFLHANHVPNRDVFSIRTHDSWNSATYEMGHAYSENNFLSIYEKEQKDAKTRIDQHWEEVQRKQDLSRNLCDELRGLKSDLDVAESEERAAKTVYNNTYGYSRERKI